MLRYRDIADHCRQGVMDGEVLSDPSLPRPPATCVRNHARLANFRFRKGFSWHWTSPPGDNFPYT